MAPKKKIEPYRGQKLEKKETDFQTTSENLGRAYKNVAGTMSIPDALMWGALRPNSSMSKEWDQVTKNFPDSALKTSDAHDFLADMEMPEGKGKDVLGVLLNVVGPEGVAGILAKSMGKAPKVLSASGKIAQTLGEWAREKGTRDFVKRNIKQKAFDNGMVEPLVETIKKEKLFSDLGDPEKLRVKLGGETKLNEELAKVGIHKSHKEEDGMIGEAGEKIAEFSRRMAKENPHARVNRNKLVNNLVQKQATRNATPGVEPIDAEKYRSKLEGVFNPQRESLIKIPNQIPKSAKALEVPEIPSEDLLKKISELDEKIDIAKKTGESNAALKKEREMAKRMLDEENLNISKENEVIDGLGLELQEVPAIPKKTKSTKDLPAFPPKEVTELLIEKEKAMRNNKKLLDAIKKNPEITPKIPAKDVDLSDLPPEIPGDSIEDLIKQKQDLLSTKGNLDKSNKAIKTENTKAAQFLERLKKEPARYIRFIQDNYSDLNELQKVKQHINKELARVYKSKGTISDFKDVEKRILEQAQEVDDAIMHELNKIDPDEAMEYRRLNNDYGNKKSLDELLKPVEASDRKSGKDTRWITRAAGGIGGGLAAWASGHPSQIAPSIVGGAVAAEAARKTVGALPEHMAKWGDNLADPLLGHLAGQGTEEMIKAPARNDKEIPQAPDHMFDFSGVEQHGVAPAPGRKPQSVVEIPEDQSQGAMDALAPHEDIHQKMDETLAPQRPQFDPYINDEILNTPLPRSSDRLLKNPNALMAKLGQVAPNQVPFLKDMLTNEPQKLKEMAPKIAMMFPTVFEDDKYGMFDGKIEDPKMQEKFLFDLAQDEDMDSIEKANMAMKIHRKESIY